MNPKIGDRIRLRRKELGITLKQLAGDRITAAQISAIENGKCNPSPGLLTYLCEQLKVDVEFFTLSNEERYRNEFDESRIACQRLFDIGDYEGSLERISKESSVFQYLTEEQKGYYYHIQGEISYKKNEFSESFDYYVKSLAHYIKTKDNNRIVDAYIKIGNCLYSSEKYDMALGYYMNSTTYVANNLDNDIIIKIYYNLAICYASLNRVKFAKEYVDKCIAFISTHECSKKDIFLPGIDMLKGLLIKETKYSDVNLASFEDAFEKYKNENDYQGMGKAKNNAALCLWDLGEHGKAIEYFEEALTYKILSGEKSIVDTYLNIVELYQEIGELDKALETINAAEERMINDGSPRGIIQIFMAKFELLCKIGEYDRAEIFAFLALDIIQKNEDFKMESTLYIKLSEMYKKMGDEKSSIEYVLKANVLASENKFAD